MKIILLCFIYFFSFCYPVFSADTEKKIPAELISDHPVSRSHFFILPPFSLQEMLKNDGDLVLVDVRSSDDFRKARIPGSINIPLYAVKTKDFLKSRSLVLINEGYGYYGLEQESEKLKKLGFQSVHILYGGLNYWRDMNGPLEGDFFYLDALSKISPAEYFVDRNYDDWLVIDVSSSNNQVERALLPGSIHIPYSGNDEKFLSKLKKFIHGNELPTLQYVLIVTGSGQDYNQIGRLLKKDKTINNIFYLKGGLAAYRKYLQDQTSVWRPHKKTIKKCGSCP